MRFDVFSIRLASPDSSVSFGTGEREYYATEPLSMALQMAFYGGGAAPSSFRQRLEKLPKWVREDTYSIEGTISAEDMKEWTEARHVSNFSPSTPNIALESLLQSALMDRCHLTFHKIPDSIDGYILSIGKDGVNGTKLRAASASDNIPNEAHSFFSSAGGKVQVVYEETDNQSQTTLFRFFNTSMSDFVSFFPNNLGAVVIDKTGLTGKFNFEVRFTQTGLADPIQEVNVAPLGLSFRKASIPLDGVVIDHIEKPSPN